MRIVLLMALLLLMGGCSRSHAPLTSPIKVGILHSLTGTMAISGQSVTDGTVMAIEEINAAGGIGGRKIEPVIADGRSDAATFASEAERLLSAENVSVIFGCWTSASRKAVRPIVEKHQSLLFYPLQYEGMEVSPNIVYIGAAPNQQILPTVKWFRENRGRRFFLVGSDYIFPRCANATIRDYLKLTAAEVVGEAYLPLASRDVEAVVAEIARKKPDVILSTINGDTNLAFFPALRAAGVKPHDVCTVSFSIAEEELRHMDPAGMAGDFAAWNYFQSIPSAANQAFVRRFKSRFGADRVTDDPIESAYISVYLWAAAARTAATDRASEVRAALRYRCFDAPEGSVCVDAENQHTWRTVRIGRIRPDGQFDIMWTSEEVIHPAPYPPSRTVEEWDDVVESLYTGWGKRWAPP